MFSEISAIFNTSMSGALKNGISLANNTKIFKEKEYLVTKRKVHDLNAVSYGERFGSLIKDSGEGSFGLINELSIKLRPIELEGHLQERIIKNKNYTKNYNRFNK